MKYTFEDLNSFVDGRFGYLYDTEQTFYNQAVDGTQAAVSAEATSKKAEMVWNRLVTLRMQQGALDFILDVVRRWQHNWEELLTSFEKQYPETPYDDSRSDLYGLIDKLFTTLEIYHTSVHDLQAKLAAHSQKQEPICLLWAVFSRNQSLLEKLYLQIENLQRLVDISDHMFRNFRPRNFY